MPARCSSAYHFIGTVVPQAGTGQKYLIPRVTGF
ncbi:hypothetical protein BVRB_1g018450 isoform B [Beta vulgaris subsp. vulgaris]|nr:hypothetical protein BVRB_1g018450 isoform B [Beta vulgaris subsp. vulgaris]